MGSVSLSGSDTLSINTRVLNNVADGNWAELTFPNDIATVKLGKNQNAIFGYNAQGTMAELKIRVLRGSSDDNYLLSQLNAQQNNFSGFALMLGQFIKKVGDGAGNITNDTYNMGAGVFQKQPEAKSSADGETEQSVSIYMLKFAQVTRVIS